MTTTTIDLGCITPDYASWPAPDPSTLVETDEVPVMPFHELFWLLLVRNTAVATIAFTLLYLTR